MASLSTKHFLIVRLSGIGDVVMASTVLKRLRGEQPESRITWLTGLAAAALVEQYAGLDGVIAIDERRLLTGDALDRAAVLAPLWWRILRMRISDVILLHADRRYRAVIAPLVGATTRMLTRAPARAGRPSLVAGRYMGDDYARLLDGPDASGPVAGHFPLADLKPAEPRGARAATPYVIIVPGGAKNVLRESALRRWPVAAYRVLASALIAEGYGVMLVGDAGDGWVRAEFADIGVDDRIGAMTLPETLDAMRGARLVVSHDTGPMHLARLVAAPLIALFGPTMPSQFLVEDERTVALWGGAHLACRPCYDGRELAPCHNNLCMSSIGAEVVLETARRLMARRA